MSSFVIVFSGLYALYFLPCIFIKSLLQVMWNLLDKDVQLLFSFLLNSI